MTHLTTCPDCQTTFRVNETQLQAHHGDVRCGKCGRIFNALAHLTRSKKEQAAEPERPTPPVADTGEQEASSPVMQPATSAEETPEPAGPVPDSPALPEPAAPAPDSPTLTPVTEPKEASETGTFEPPAFEFGDPAPFVHTLEASPGIAEISAGEPAGAVLEPIEQSAEPAREEHAEPPAPLAAEPVAVITAATHSPVEDLPASPAAPVPRVASPEPDAATAMPRARARPQAAPRTVRALPRVSSRWLWLAGSLVLVLALLLQAAYFFRSTLAVGLPGTRPVLQSVCSLLGCRVDLPRNPDFWVIESSDLQADPARPSVIILSGLLRNRAPYVQAYPLVELTLTNAQDETVARRVFTPGEYLRRSVVPDAGAPGGGEAAIRLYLDIGNLPAVGYRLYLFYS